ncbi:amphi-Trp domain-containing protein [Psychrobacter sp. FDAARGOS_221]|uniref:amphi-Trp domain-containing protein n=1 Tax=Psychrobacter sp. FDAARGOS_221 TaxID=1975705 RepID=UPI000BB56561|nr:amphi-Trp domain-containing protein [Psychrobacter sp. FDAARGOS_221]PNK60612.1 amphi-Trp domain-containing protein [Psychrobacter sp. FDAARGOS_221]
MGKETVLFKSKERRSKQEVVAFLRQLADKVEEGSLVLSKGADELEVQFPENFSLEVEVEDEVKKRNRIEHSLEIELKWYDDDDNQQASELVLK